MRIISKPIAPPRGVTLLELVLALGLTVVVMGLISMAISLNFRMYDDKRTSIEEAQLARSLLRHIADDIRAAVQHMPPDLSGLETVVGNTQNASEMLGGAGLGALSGAVGGGQGSGQGQGNNQQGGGGGQQVAGQSGGAGAGGGNSGGGSTNNGGGSGLPVTVGSNIAGVDAQTEQATSTYGEGQAGGIIGLYGSSTELQIDISRLPRVDQYQAELSTDGIGQVVDIPSDMKTVTYFLQPEEGMLDVGLDGRGRGLMRHVLDRAVSRWSQENGSASDSMGELETLADEVVGLQFMYFDGVTWTSDWDSQAMEGLPVAIEITLAIQAESNSPTTSLINPLATTTADGEPLERYYTLTVNLPTATSIEVKEQAAAEKAAAEETALSQTGELDTSGDAAAAGLGGAGAGGFSGIGGGGPGGPGGGQGKDGQGRNGQGGDRPEQGDGRPKGPTDGKRGDMRPGSRKGDYSSGLGGGRRGR